MIIDSFSIKLEIKGWLGGSLFKRIDGFKVVDISQNEENTIVAGCIPDQGGFNPLIRRISDMGMEIVSIYCIKEECGRE